MLEGRIHDLTTAQSKLEKEIREAKFDDQIKEKRNAIAQQDAEKEKLGNELVALNKQASTRATLEVLRGSKREKDEVVKAS
jgi:restriction endonuclease S subunit